MFCASVCRSGGTEALSDWRDAFLLRHVEIGSGAGLEPFLDRIQMRVALAILLSRGANPVLRGQHLEIGVGDGCQVVKRNHIAIETVRDRCLFRACAASRFLPQKSSS